ncbi:phytanoyl-CoA dioxygenase family protein [Sphingomonas sp. HF-S4]|uniref:Phytanoyl-CoA dioxygenase family protein n=1 Tax=Sphingomonas agrestis TaxID=3080540 RepID=A0ABU3YAZ7_9SPHN|nr:phytanoyl-CoA dioxygenase family protein [Sphingomonas sp. HF-S4]MDV3458570.1 phytanoyl-CoA dioxygenase family protein [Sphingomonas sp. HF-S4]
MNLDEHGAAHLPGAAAPFLDALERVAAAVPADRAGVRLHGVPGLAQLLAADALGTLAGPAMRPVRTILFDKSAAANWALGWHQDRTIAVQARAEARGFGAWSIKQGMPHVEPPFSLIERMRTLRIHLDPVPEDNAPLLIAPGSHRLGRIAEPDLAGVVERCGVAICLAEAGDVWLYATPIVHASAAASGARHRRVLQVDYSADALPPPLAWLGI